MPIEVGIWRIDNKPEKVSFSSMESETKLEDILHKDISLLSPDLMLLGRQVPTAHGTFIDLLAMDAEGNLSVIELKRHKTPRQVVAQAIDYASWVQTLSYGEIAEIYSESNNGSEFEQGFAEAFDINPPEKLNESLQIIIVAAELDNASERIISYLTDNFGVPINAVFFRYFKEGDSEFLTRTWLIDPQEAETKAGKRTTLKGREAWNGQDFYVAFGADENRSWEDAQKYGFVSAGFGRWYTRTLGGLTPGKRVFVCIPGEGYVGVGIVTDTVKPLSEFTVTIDGADILLVDAHIQANYLRDYIGDPEKCEYLVRIEWIKTVPRESAYWEKGMYANQNTATRLRNRFTLERLTQHFGLEAE